MNEVSEKKVNVRKLNGLDLFEFTRMVQKLGIKDKLKQFSKEAQEKAKLQAELAKESGNIGEEVRSNIVNDAGFDVIYDVIELFTTNNAEKEIFEFLSKPLGVANGQEAASIPLAELFEYIYEIADVKTWKVFLSRVLR